MRTPVDLLMIHNSAKTFWQLRGALFNFFCRQGLRVEVCLPNDCENSIKDFNNQNIKVHIVKLSRTGLSPWSDLSYIYQLKRVLNHVQPDSVFCTTVKPVAYTPIAATLSGASPQIYSMITGLGFSFFGTNLKSKIVGKIVAKLYSSSLRKNQCVIFQNLDDQRVLEKVGALSKQQKATRVMGSGVNLEDFSPEPLPPGDLSFLMVARLIKEKGVFEYLEAAEKIKSEFSNIKFKLVGPFDPNPSGIKEAELYSYCDRGVVEYEGYLPDIRPSIKASHVMVLPTYYREGIPKSLCEALAMGRPIITTDWPGCRDLVEENQNAKMIHPTSTESLYRAFKYFIENQSRLAEMSKEARLFAEKHLGANKINSQILEVLGFKPIDSSTDHTKLGT